MDEVLRRGINALIKLPWMVATADALEIHRLMAEVLRARSFRINWVIDEVYYDNGSSILVAVQQHLQTISKNRGATLTAEMITGGHFSEGLTNPNIVKIFKVEYQIPEPEEMEENDEGEIYPAQPRLIRTPVSPTDLPAAGATYVLLIS